MNYINSLKCVLEKCRSKANTMERRSCRKSTDRVMKAIVEKVYKLSDVTLDVVYGRKTGKDFPDFCLQCLYKLKRLLKEDEFLAFELYYTKPSNERLSQEKIAAKFDAANNPKWKSRLRTTGDVSEFLLYARLLFLEIAVDNYKDCEELNEIIAKQLSDVELGNDSTLTV